MIGVLTQTRKGGQYKLEKPLKVQFFALPTLGKGFHGWDISSDYAMHKGRYIHTSKVLATKYMGGQLYRFVTKSHSEYLLHVHEGE